MKHLKNASIALLLAVLPAIPLHVSAQSAANPRHPIMAHRGVHQTYPREGLDRNTCTADRINPPTHDYIENTIPSLKATVELGADIIEIDIHPTTDGDFVVFHDWTLECRTNGTGVTRHHNMAYLRGLDAGYGYTADRGATYPLRGKGIGLIVSLMDVLSAVPNTVFLINFKSRSPDEGRALAAYLAARNIGPERVLVYGNEAPVEAFLAAAQGFRGFSRQQAVSCLKGYVMRGWFGAIPRACHNTLILVPHSHTRLVWGWRTNFAARMARLNSQVFLVGPVPENAHSELSGLNDPALLAGLPDGVGVWTDAVEVIAPKLRRTP